MQLVQPGFTSEQILQLPLESKYKSATQDVQTVAEEQVRQFGKEHGAQVLPAAYYPRMHRMTQSQLFYRRKGLLPT